MMSWQFRAAALWRLAENTPYIEGILSAVENEKRVWFLHLSIIEVANEHMFNIEVLTHVIKMHQIFLVYQTFPEELKWILAIQQLTLTL